MFFYDFFFYFSSVLENRTYTVLVIPILSIYSLSIIIFVFTYSYSHILCLPKVHIPFVQSDFSMYIEAIKIRCSYNIVLALASIPLAIIFLVVLVQW